MDRDDHTGMDPKQQEHDPQNPPASGSQSISPGLLARCGLGGVLMGLANLVPGISGGTMLLASGVYPRFIDAVSRVTRLKLSLPPLVVLGAVVGSAFLAIVLLAGPVKGMVVDHRWAAYALFIGLTLGGLPVVWRLARPATGSTWVGATVGFVAMAGLALAQASGLGAGAGGERSFLMMFVAGLAGASAMILPGVSGGYLLLVIGQYVPILSAIDEAKQAVRAGDFGAAMDPALGVFLPVGIGVVVGIAVVSNVLEKLLARHAKPTLGALMGLLVGAVVGLWPFQQGTEPVPGDVVKGQVMTEPLIAELDREDWPTAYFTPSSTQIGGAVGLVLLGFGLTLLVDRVGREKPSRDEVAQ